MRSKKEIARDVRCCFLEDGSCKNCSYYNCDTCTDNCNSLEKEIVDALESDEDYNNGLEDALELVKEVYDRDAKDMQECFGVNGGFYDVIKHFNIHEIKEKFEEWKERKNIKVGDVVNFDDAIGVVLDIDEDNVLTVFNENRIVQFVGIDFVTKTEKHLKEEVETLLERLRCISYFNENDKCKPLK